jgi:hypothetical protein
METTLFFLKIAKYHFKEALLKFVVVLAIAKILKDILDI